MSHPTFKDARALIEWRSPLGVVSAYLRFDAGDRSQSWRAELHNQVGRLRGAVEDADHERRMAVLATTDRLLARCEDEKSRPPPRGEAGFLEVAEREGAERWWATAIPPTATMVSLAEQAMVAPLVDLSRRGEGVGVALVSSERIRLLRFAEGELDDIEEMEITLWISDWRERKSSSSRDPGRAQGVNSSGRDQHDERLDHNRRRFIKESGSLAGERLRERGLDRVVAFGPAKDVEEFDGGLRSTGVRLEAVGDADLISSPTDRLVDAVAEAVDRLAAESDRRLAERALGKMAGAPGATGIQETEAALEEGRVEHLLFDPAIGDRAEPLVRGALAGSAGVTVARDGVAELLEPAQGVAGILRY